jgi:hypothetical protein
MAYAPRPLAPWQQADFLQAVGQVTELPDARQLMNLLIAKPKGLHD